MSHPVGVGSSAYKEAIAIIQAYERLGDVIPLEQMPTAREVAKEISLRTPMSTLEAIAWVRTRAVQGREWQDWDG